MSALLGTVFMSWLDFIKPDIMCEAPDVFECYDVALHVHMLHNEVAEWYFVVHSDRVLIVGANSRCEAEDLKAACPANNGVSVELLQWPGALVGPYRHEYAATCAAEWAFGETVGFWAPENRG